MLLGNLYFNEKRYDEAIDIFKKALLLQPIDTNIFTLLGNSYVMKNELELATISYKSAIDNDSENDELKLIYLEIIKELINNKFNRGSNNDAA